MNVRSTAPTTLEATDLQELSGSVAGAIRDLLRAALNPEHRLLEIDLSKITFIDSSGLGALISLHRTMVERGGQLHLVNPSAICQQILELTRINRALEIVTR